MNIQLCSNFFQRQLKYKVASSFDSREYAEKRRPEGLSDTDVREKEPVIEEDTTNLDTTDSFAGREVGDIGKAHSHCCACYDHHHCHYQFQSFTSFWSQAVCGRPHSLMRLGDLKNAVSWIFLIRCFECEGNVGCQVFAIVHFHFMGKCGTETELLCEWLSVHVMSRRSLECGIYVVGSQRCSSVYPAGLHGHSFTFVGLSINFYGPRYTSYLHFHDSHFCKAPEEAAQ